jgi:hypothetical protein
MAAEEVERLHLAEAQQCPDSADTAALRREVAGLHHALATRAPIEQAKGMLMMRYGVSADVAFGLLKGWSSEYELKLRTVAVVLVRILSTDDAALDLDVSPEELLGRVLTDDEVISSRLNQVSVGRTATPPN